METIILTFNKPNTPKGNIFESIIDLEQTKNVLINKSELINEATKKKHKEILNQLINDLNLKLKVINFKFVPYRDFYTLTFNNQHLNSPISIRLNALSNKEYKFITTYTGEYDIEISNDALYTVQYYWTKCNDINKLEETILSRIKINKRL